jgi:glycosyltransferase involved in cell wall biosynthesis
VPFEDPDAMARAIGRVAAMPEAEWAAMSEAAHRTAAGYTWDDATERFEAALRVAVARSAEARSAPARPAGALAAPERSPS